MSALKRIFALFLICVSASLVVLAEDIPAKDEDGKAAAVEERKEPAKGADDADKTEKADKSDEGIWLTAKQRELLLKRWAADVSEQFDLDEGQHAKAEESIVRRWGKFLDDNRGEFQPLMNEFLEMRLGLEPPPKETVQKWADRAGPAFDKFRDQLHQGQSEFREMLNFKQRAKFEIEAMKFEAGMAFAQAKLKQWKDGDYSKDDLWEEPRAERRRRRVEREAKDESSETKPAEADDQIALEVKRWDEYVAEFVKMYQLDQGQRDAAVSFLTELKGRALEHRDRRKEDIAKLEARINSKTGSASDEEDLKKQLAELYGPVDDMFKDLRRRLDQLPTAAQRESAQKTEPKKDG